VVVAKGLECASLSQSVVNDCNRTWKWTSRYSSTSRYDAAHLARRAWVPSESVSHSRFLWLAHDLYTKILIVNVLYIEGYKLKSKSSVFYGLLDFRKVEVLLYPRHFRKTQMPATSHFI